MREEPADNLMAAISWPWYNGSYTMAAQPIKSLELHYTMIPFLIISISYSTFYTNLLRRCICILQVYCIPFLPMCFRSFEPKSNAIVLNFPILVQTWDRYSPSGLLFDPRNTPCSFSSYKNYRKFSLYYQMFMTLFS